MFSTKFCALSQNFISTAYLVLKLLQNIIHSGGGGGRVGGDTTLHKLRKAFKNTKQKVLTLSWPQYNIFKPGQNVQ